MNSAIGTILLQLAALFGLEIEAQYALPLLAPCLSIAGVLMLCFGFYVSRSVNSLLVFCLITAIGGLYILPVRGVQTAATFCAVAGVCGGFLAFRWYRFGGSLLCGFLIGILTAAVLKWPEYSLSGGQLAGLILISMLAAGLTFLFPLWGLCGCTALWGGVTLGMAMDFWPLGLLFGTAGCILQLKLFRNQKTFPRIMPRNMQHFLEQRKLHRGEKEGTM